MLCFAQHPVPAPLAVPILVGQNLPLGVFIFSVEHSRALTLRRAPHGPACGPHSDNRSSSWKNPKRKPASWIQCPMKVTGPSWAHCQRLFCSRVKSYGALLSPFPKNLETTHFQWLMDRFSLDSSIYKEFLFAGLSETTSLGTPA